MCILQGWSTAKKPMTTWCRVRKQMPSQSGYVEWLSSHRTIAQLIGSSGLMLFYRFHINSDMKLLSLSLSNCAKPKLLTSTQNLVINHCNSHNKWLANTCTLVESPRNNDNESFSCFLKHRLEARSTEVSSHQSDTAQKINSLMHPLCFWIKLPWCESWPSPWSVERPHQVRLVSFHTDCSVLTVRP